MLQVNIIQGDKFIMTLSLADTEGKPVDLTGLSFLFAGKYDPIKDDTLAFTGQCETIGNGQLRCTIPASETGKLKNANRYESTCTVYWDIWCVEREQQIINGIGIINTGISYRKEKNLL